MQRWLAHVRHDLLKHAAWRARDLSEAMAAGIVARPADVIALRDAVLALPDEEGRAAGALAVWRGLRDQLEAPTSSEMEAALDRFEAAVVEAEDKVRALCPSDDARNAARACEAVLALDGAFDVLAREVKLARPI